MPVLSFLNKLMFVQFENFEDESRFNISRVRVLKNNTEWFLTWQLELSIDTTRTSDAIHEHRWDGFPLPPQIEKSDPSPNKSCQRSCYFKMTEINKLSQITIVVWNQEFAITEFENILKSSLKWTSNESIILKHYN